jgi:hypothetical protein
LSAQFKLDGLCSLCACVWGGGGQSTAAGAATAFLEIILYLLSCRVLSVTSSDTALSPRPKMQALVGRVFHSLTCEGSSDLSLSAGIANGRTGEMNEQTLRPVWKCSFFALSFHTSTKS